ncbi:MAG: ribosome biogenesis GTPase Der, partial [bacterium]|nr:ribosome biogenesis GTPase Der [bacterium]
HYGEATWLDRVFCLIDTGGLLLEETSDLMQSIYEQTVYAISEADLVMFVIDARDGVTAVDEDVARRLHKAGKEVMLIANKVEKDEIGYAETPWYRLGFGEPQRISAEHGRGIGDMLDEVIAKLPKRSTLQGALTGVQVAIVGRPNVGKSSFINRILGEDRLLVNATPGTTRDAIDSHVRVNKKSYTLIDTAGMRKPRRIGETLEKATVGLSLKRIQRCEVAVLILDAEVAIGEQDVRIAAYIERHGKACVIAVNKWDAIDKETNTFTTFVERLHEVMPFLAHAPVISMSVLTGQRVIKLFPLIDQVLEENQRRVPVAALNTFLKKVTRQRLAPTYRGNYVRFSFLTQTLVQPPTFLCYVNRPEGVAQNYQRYLENQLRQHFGFAGSPIRLYFRKK